MSDSDLRVNLGIYPDAVICDRMHLMGPKSDQLGPINIFYLKSPSAKTNFLSTQDWVLGLDVNRFQKHLNEKAILSARPVIRKLSSVYVLGHSGVSIRCCPMAD